jgi:8-oxo-dGTP diphosphatase
MRHSVDAIAWQEKHGVRYYVIIRRLNFPEGLALPGGGIEKGECKYSAVVREMKEETGLTFLVKGWLPTLYNKKGRDPRWDAISSVAFGECYGDECNETGKTEVLHMTREEILSKKNLFVFDHFEIFLDFLTMGRE